MKTFILFFTFLIAAGNISLAQDIVNSKNTATERAPIVSTVTDNSGQNQLNAFGGRWFGQNAAATSFFAKGFLNTSGTYTNFSTGTTDLYGAMEFSNTGTLYCIAVASGAPLQSLDTATGVLTPLGAITGLSGEQVLSLAFNTVNNTMYLTTTIAGSDKLYTLDLTTRVATLVGSVGQNYFGIAINNAGLGYGISIADNLYSINLTTAVSTLIGPIGFDANFIQGMTFDKQTDSLWYAAYNNTALRGELRTVNLATGSTALIAPFTPTAEVCGFAIPFSSPPPPLGGNTLVLVHDSTLADTPKRKADRDSMFVYLSSLISNYTVRQFDTTSTFDSLSNYSTIFVMETSFDATNVRYLGAAARNQFKAWLTSGTAQNKKSLIMMGGDLGWNYSRNLSAAQDLEFAETFGKFIYRVDNGMSTAPFTQGITIDIGNNRGMTTTPTGSGYWPDGCSVVPGGSSVLYRYTNHSAADTVAGIGNIQPGYLMASVFQDPRYFTGGLGEVMKAVFGWVRTNGGTITGVNNNVTSNELNTPFDFSLSQNYPNPFNPSTKINFAIPKSGVVNLKVFDILGKEVAQLVNEFKTAGNYSVDFNASSLSSGTYFYRIETNGFVATKKMSLLK